MRLFDSHSHIDDISFDKDFPQTLQRAQKAGVAAIMVVGINLKTTKKAMKLVKKHDHLYTSVGVHPHDAKTCTNEVISALISLASHEKVKAWGETGLDFNRMHSPKDVQEKWFIRQIEAADELGLPMIFHERDSQGRFLEILTDMDNQKRRGVVHCFSGTKQEMFKYLDLGYHIGVTGIVTLKQRGQYLRQLIPHIPEDRLLIETDAPYLTPAPMKNKTRRNEPAFVAAVFHKIADITQKDPRNLSETIWNNTLKLYNISSIA